jgi:uncharacterized metal-binding protein
METTQINKGIVLACSGGSDLGELSDRVARKLRDNKVYTMKCLAMIGAEDKVLIKSLANSNVLVIDGCPVDCGKRIMEEAWLSNYKYIRLTDLGYEKGKTTINEEIVNSIYDKIISEDDTLVIENKNPEINECCK